MLRVREMASALVEVGLGLRNPLAEDDVAPDTLLRLGVVQPKGIAFKTMTILVGGRNFRKLGMKEGRGLNTAVKLTLPVASIAVCSNRK